jgi:hypothetical protein
LHHLATTGLLASCGARGTAALPPLQPLSFQALLVQYKLEVAGVCVNVRKVGVGLAGKGVLVWVLAR